MTPKISEAHQAWRRRRAEKYADTVAYSFNKTNTYWNAASSAHLSGAEAEFEVARLVGYLEAMDDFHKAGDISKFAHALAIKSRLAALLSAGEAE